MDEDAGGLEHLLAQAQRGDQESRDELLRGIRAGVLRFLLARGLPDHDADDLAQETCLGVLRALPQWQDVGRPVWAFVFAVVRNKMADRARSLAARRDIPVGEDSYLADTVAEPRPGPPALVESDEAAGRVRALIETLPPTQREVIMLRVIVGLSTADTAATLGLTPGSVRVLQHRAVTALRARLGVVRGGVA
jgi:RNA polymerase sigma-70 factor (ECF subfamily)